MTGRTRWDGVALQKLVRVLGDRMAEELFVETLRGLGLAQLATVDDLYLFAQQLAKSGGFAGAVGGLLSVHAVIHGATHHQAR